MVGSGLVDGTDEPNGTGIFVADEEEVGLVESEVDFFNRDVKVVIEEAVAGASAADKSSSSGGFDAVIAKVDGGLMNGVADIKASRIIRNTREVGFGFAENIGDAEIHEGLG